MLCEKTDARTRSGPDHYMWDADSPAMRVVGGAGPPAQDEFMGRFGRAAALGQPKAYARAIAADLWRFVDPDERAGFGQPPVSLNLGASNAAWEQFNRTAVEPLYGPSEVRFRRSAGWFESAQKLSRVPGALVLLATLLTLLAVPLLPLLLASGAVGARVVVMRLGATVDRSGPRALRLPSQRRPVADEPGPVRAGGRRAP